MQLYFRDPGTLKSATFGLLNPSQNDILQLLANKAGVQYDTELYILYFASLHIIISKLANKGGCRNGKSIVEKLIISETQTIKLQNVKSSNNNCLIQCFIKGCNLKGNQVNLTL